MTPPTNRTIKALASLLLSAAGLLPSFGCFATEDTTPASHQLTTLDKRPLWAEQLRNEPHQTSNLSVTWTKNGAQLSTNNPYTPLPPHLSSEFLTPTLCIMAENSKCLSYAAGLPSPETTPIYEFEHNSYIYHLANELTVSVDVLPTSPTGSQTILSGSLFRLSLESGVVAGAVWLDNAWWKIADTRPLALGRYASLDLVVSGGSMELFVDGLQVNSLPAPQPIESSLRWLAVGAVPNHYPDPTFPGAGPFRGLIGELTLRDYAAPRSAAMALRWNGNQLADIVAHASVEHTPNLAATVGPERDDDGIYFDGSNWVTVTDMVTDFDETLLEMWFMPSDLPGTIFDSQNFTVSLATPPSGSGLLVLETTANESAHQTSYSITPGRWHRLSIDSKTDIKLHVDNVQIAEIPTRLELKQGFRLGAKIDDSRPLVGMISGFKLGAGRTNQLERPPVALIDGINHGTEDLIAWCDEGFCPPGFKRTGYDFANRHERLDLSRPFTWTFRFKVGTAKPDWDMIRAGDFSFSMYKNDLYVYFITYNGDLEFIVENVVFVPGGRYEIQVIYSGSELIMLIDGEPVTRANVIDLKPGGGYLFCSVGPYFDEFSVRLDTFAASIDAPVTRFRSLLGGPLSPGRGEALDLQRWVPKFSPPPANTELFAYEVPTSSPIEDARSALAPAAVVRTKYNFDNCNSIIPDTSALAAEIYAGLDDLASPVEMADFLRSARTRWNSFNYLVHTHYIQPVLHKTCEIYGGNCVGMGLGYGDYLWREEFHASGGNPLDLPDFEEFRVGTWDCDAVVLERWLSEFEMALSKIEVDALSKFRALYALESLGLTAEGDLALERRDYGSAIAAYSGASKKLAALDWPNDPRKASSCISYYSDKHSLISAAHELSSITIGEHIGNIQEYLPFAINSAWRGMASDNAQDDYFKSGVDIVRDRKPGDAEASRLAAWAAIANTYIEWGRSQQWKTQLSAAERSFRAVFRDSFGTNASVDDSIASPFSLPSEVIEIRLAALAGLGMISRGETPFGLPSDSSPNVPYPALLERALRTLTYAARAIDKYEKYLQKERDADSFRFTLWTEYSVRNDEAITLHADLLDNLEELLEAERAVQTAKLAHENARRAAANPLIAVLGSLGKIGQGNPIGKIMSGPWSAVVSYARSGLENRVEETRRALEQAVNALAEVRTAVVATRDGWRSAEIAAKNLQLRVEGELAEGELTAAWWLARKLNAKNNARLWTDRAVTATWQLQQSIERLTDAGERPLNWTENGFSLSRGRCAFSFPSQWALIADALIPVVDCLDQVRWEALSSLEYLDEHISIKNDLVSPVEWAMFTSGLTDGRLNFSIPLEYLETRWPGRYHMMVGDVRAQVRYSRDLAAPPFDPILQEIDLTVEGCSSSVVRLYDPMNFEPCGDPQEWLPKDLYNDFPSAHNWYIKRKLTSTRNSARNMTLRCTHCEQEIAQFETTLPSNQFDGSGPFEGSGLARDWEVRFLVNESLQYQNWLRFEQIEDVILSFQVAEPWSTASAGVAFEYSSSFEQIVRSAAAVGHGGSAIISMGRLSVTAEVDVTAPMLAHARSTPRLAKVAIVLVPHPLQAENYKYAYLKVTLPDGTTKFVSAYPRQGNATVSIGEIDSLSAPALGHYKIENMYDGEFEAAYLVVEYAVQ